jgi:hypothetical protein
MSDGVKRLNEGLSLSEILDMSSPLESSVWLCMCCLIDNVLSFA